MKVMSFRSTSDSDFGRIAQWLEEHAGITILSAVQSQCLIGQTTRVTYTLFYSEPTSKQAAIKLKTWASLDHQTMNDWLATKKVNEIVSLTQSESPSEISDNSEPRLRIILLYR